MNKLSNYSENSVPTAPEAKLRYELGIRRRSKPGKGMKYPTRLSTISTAVTASRLLISLLKNDSAAASTTEPSLVRSKNLFLNWRLLFFQSDSACETWTGEIKRGLYSVGRVKERERFGFVKRGLGLVRRRRSEMGGADKDTAVAMVRRVGGDPTR